jgi:2-isopropylmalate synthase
MGTPLDVASAHRALRAATPETSIVIFDTTLRDGEQAPGISLDAREKVEIATQLRRLQVDVIEAGFPAASRGDFNAVKAVAAEVGSDDRDATPPVVAALARCVDADIEHAAKAIAPAQRQRLHVFLSTSDIHRRHMLHASEEEILAQAVDAVRLARTFTDDVEFSPQDATRTDFSFLVDIVAAVVEAGATTVNIPDTVGYALPHDFGAWIAEIRRRVPAIDEQGIVLSVHCHNDLGLAVANSLEAVRNGARQVEVAVNGIGERAGNCSLEEVVMAIRTRADLLGLDTGVHTPEITRTSRLVSTLTGYPVQRNKAVVGQNAFAHESGIHQHGVLQDRLTYEIMKTEDVGADGSQIVLGKHSGRHAFRNAVAELGFELDEAEIARTFARFKELADRKKEVTTKDIEAIVAAEVHVSVADEFELTSLTVSGGTDTDPSATVAVRGPDGVVREATASGDGMVDAACGAIRRAVAPMMGRDEVDRDGIRMVSFHVAAVTEGVDALGDVTVELEVGGGQRFTGRGVSTDIVEASARAYLDALNRSTRITPRGGEFRP